MFPAYNEEANIKLAVLKAIEILETITDKFEILIVDDGSLDKTGQIIDALAREDNRIVVIHHAKNRGYGDALWTGINAAKNDWFFYTDADLQFDLNDIQKLIRFIPEYKAVIGYRSPRRDSFMRLLNAKGWNRLVRLLFGLKVRDIDCAFKIFERVMLTGLPLKTRGATMSAEVLIRLQRMGIAWKEVPVSHFPRLFGSPTGAKPAVIVRAFRELFNLYCIGLK